MLQPRHSAPTRTPWVLSGVSGTLQVSIDPNGNLCSTGGTTCSNGTTTYQWDAENRLVAVLQGSTSLASFTYDGKGRRATKTAGGVTHTYVYDEANIIEDRFGTQTVDYVQAGLDRPVAQRDQANVVSYYLADHLGSITQMTNSTGTVTLTREYDPWGNLLQGNTTSGYAFTGREWDPEVSLTYYRARYYDAKIGRFISTDPLGQNARHPSVYSYVENQPTQLSDPFGLCAYLHCEGIPTKPEMGAPGYLLVLPAPLHCYLEIECPSKYHWTVELYGDNTKHVNRPNAERDGRAWTTPVYPPGQNATAGQSPATSDNCAFEDRLMKIFVERVPPPYIGYPGPNSSTFVTNVIGMADGRVTFPDIAYGWNFGPVVPKSGP